MPYAPAIVLVDFSLFPWDFGDIMFFLSPLAVPSIPDVCCIADGQDEMHLIPLYPNSGSWDFPMACANCEFATETKTWAELKALFR